MNSINRSQCVGYNLNILIYKFIFLSCIALIVVNWFVLTIIVNIVILTNFNYLNWYHIKTIIVIKLTIILIMYLNDL
jgi:hypothetical protein